MTQPSYRRLNTNDLRYQTQVNGETGVKWIVDSKWPKVIHLWSIHRTDGRELLILLDTIEHGYDFPDIDINNFLNSFSTDGRQDVLDLMATGHIIMKSTWRVRPDFTSRLYTHARLSDEGKNFLNNLRGYDEL